MSESDVMERKAADTMSWTKGASWGRRMALRIRNMLLLLLGSAAAGTLLLLLVFLLPVGSARRHVEASLEEMVESEAERAGNEQRKAVIQYKENFTDCLMVQNAIEKVEGRSVLEHAMYVFHKDLLDDTTWATEDSLVSFLRQGEDGMYLKEYSKYWHGYLVYLKPLLVCMSWRHVETFLLAAQTFLLAAAAGAAFWKKRFGLGGGIICAFLFMKPMRIWLSLTMSACWSIAMWAALLMVLCYERIEKKNRWEEFFALIGIVTAYLDFLTYPIVTLGVPLCIWLVQSLEKAYGGRVRLCRFFWNGACWAAGYAGMWGLKWVVAEITCHSGTLRNAVWSVIYRTSPLDGYRSIFSGVGRTWEAVLAQYDSPLYGIFFGLIALSAIVSVLWCLVRARSAAWGISVICLAAVALLPFVWLVLTQNHTAIHCSFTFRIMGVSVMALWCMAVVSVSAIRRKAAGDGR